MQYLWHYKSQIFGYFQTKKKSDCLCKWMDAIECKPVISDPSK